MANLHEVKLSQMNEAIKMLGSSTEKYGDPTLERFLINRAMDPKKAAKMFVEWQKWRTSFVPLGFIPDSEIAEQLEERKIFFQGFSKDGHPVMSLNANKHYPAKDRDQYKKFIVQFLDKAIASGMKGKEIGNEKIVAIIDMQNAGYKYVDANRLITCIKIIQTYYPERLAKLYMLNMPWFFRGVWKMVALALEKETLDKVMIVSNEKERTQFMAEIGEDALPKEFGGNAKLQAYKDIEARRLQC
ncbi:CRAL-TRIO lipid binding domain-containing protein [Artemisia annua]|uniref:CRAL-TRIO lipid binding domain-containing protein n=1 Tax=Artemisia annua TaxID=35608 RepID=A0A2U1PS68_ARTAN|nr:CRAL-TRIO lipid binding domain-containing protein [Artemisia annua]